MDGPFEVAHGQLTQWGHGFLWGLGVGAAVVLLLGLISVALVVDACAHRWPLIVLDSRDKKRGD